MQYPGVIKVTVIRETTAMATAPAQLVPVRAAVSEHAGHHESEHDEWSTSPTTTAADTAGAPESMAAASTPRQMRARSQAP